MLAVGIGSFLVLAGRSECSIARQPSAQIVPHLHDVLRALRQEKPDEARRLADEIEQVGPPFRGHLIVEHIGQRGTENERSGPVAFSFRVPADRLMPVAARGAGPRARALARRAPFDAAIPVRHQVLGIAAIACRRDLEASNPGVESLIRPRDCGRLTHHATFRASSNDMTVIASTLSRSRSFWISLMISVESFAMSAST